MLQDPLNDAMALIKNAEAAGKGQCQLRPASKLIGRVLEVVRAADYVAGPERGEDGRGAFRRVRREGSVGTPEGVKLQLQGDEVTVSGKLGSLQRRFPHPRVSLSLTGADLVIRSELPGRREKAVVGTFAAHVRNMIQGVTAGFTYRMKIVYAHFPMKASVKGAEFVIENFLGERSPRRTRIVGE